MKKREAVLVILLVGLVGFFIIELGGKHTSISRKIAGAWAATFGTDAKNIRYEPAPMIAPAPPMTATTATTSTSDVTPPACLIRPSVSYEKGEYEIRRVERATPVPAPPPPKPATNP